MAKPLRINVGGIVYHVLNRANARVPIFDTEGDYLAFLKALTEAHEKVPMRLLCYNIMPNHWHLVLWPHSDGDLSRFMHWATVTHASRWQAAHETVGFGHLYRGRFRNFPVEDDRHYLTVCRYAERNALRAGLVERAEDWPWSSLAQRLAGNLEGRPPLSEGPMPFPENWLERVNQDQTEKELATIRACIQRGMPFGGNLWVRRVAAQLKIDLTPRPRGRPRKS